MRCLINNRWCLPDSVRGLFFLLLSSFWATMRTNAMKLLPLDLWHKIWTNWLGSYMRTYTMVLHIGHGPMYSYIFSITRSHSILSMCAYVIIQPEALRRLHKHDINFYYAHNISLVFFSSSLIRTADRHLYGHNLRCLWLFFALFQYSASTHCAFISYGSDSQRELNIMPTAKYINKFIFALNKRMYIVQCTSTYTYLRSCVSSNDFVLKSKHHLPFGAIFYWVNNDLP